MSEESKIELPTASADGRRNAYTHRCVVVHQSRPYAGCLGRLDGRVKGDVDCAGAVRSGSCPAIAMREQETLQGRAIYFLERRAAQLPEPTRAWAVPGQSKKAPSRPSAPAPAAMPTYADAVNVALQRMHQRRSDPPAAPAHTAPVRKLQLQPGESPLAALRRNRAQ